MTICYTLPKGDNPHVEPYIGSIGAIQLASCLNPKPLTLNPASPALNPEPYTVLQPLRSFCRLRNSCLTQLLREHLCGKQGVL